MSDKNIIIEYLDDRYSRVNTRDFYRTIFPLGSLEKKEDFKQGMYHGIALELMPKTKRGKNIKRYSITDDLDRLDELTTHSNFILLSPISYAGKSREGKNARFIYALAIDLDGVNETYQINDLFYQTDTLGPGSYHPIPTFVVSSGSGIHFYYVFDKPIPCFKHIIKQMDNLKNNLIYKIWNKYTTVLYKQKQYQSIFQGFRLVGGLTKKGGKVIAYKVGNKVSIDYLNKFVEEKNRVTQFSYQSKLSLAEAKEKYPEWYEKRIVKKDTTRGHWTINRAVYDWWKEKIVSKITEGHRYFGIMCLAIYAKKCGIQREELEKDAFSFIPHLDDLTEIEGNNFTREDVIAALEMFNDDYITFSIKKISDLTNVRIDKNKRNHRKQKKHLKRARAVQAIDYPDGSWRNIEGRPSKETLVKEYIKKHPTETVTQMARALKVDRKTVYKYLN